MIEEYIHRHRIRRYDQETRGIPNGLIDLMNIPGPKTVALLHK
jgi:hypothetical protein